MAVAPDKNVLEIKFSAYPAWILIIFGAIMFCLGIMFTLPMAPARNIPLGIAIATGSIAAIFGARYWLKHLPVMLRFRPEGLEFVKNKTVFAWADIEHVAVQTIYHKGEVNFLCIRLRPESKAQYNIKPDGLFARVAKSITGDFDLIMNDQNFGMLATDLQEEIEKWKAANVVGTLRVP